MRHQGGVNAREKNQSTGKMWAGKRKGEERGEKRERGCLGREEAVPGGEQRCLLGTHRLDGFKLSPVPSPPLRTGDRMQQTG